MNRNPVNTDWIKQQPWTQAGAVELKQMRANVNSKIVETTGHIRLLEARRSTDPAAKEKLRRTRAFKTMLENARLGINIAAHKQRHENAKPGIRAVIKVLADPAIEISEQTRQDLNRLVSYLGRI